MPAWTTNVFVRDLAEGTTTLVSVTPGGMLSNDPSFGTTPTAFFGPDGRSLLFTSGAPLVASDGNHASDIYAASTPFATPNEIHFSAWQYDTGQKAGSVEVTVVRNAPHDGPASVNYKVEGDTARAGDDFTPVSGTLNFEPGQATATFTIPLNPARSSDTRKTATLVLSDPVGATLGYPTSVLSLDGPPATPPVPISTPDSHAAPDRDHADQAEDSGSALGSLEGGVQIHGVPGQTSRTRAAAAPGVEAADVVGPVVTRVSLAVSRRRIIGLTIQFNEALAATGANLPTNYSVRTLGGGRRLAAGAVRRVRGVPSRSRRRPTTRLHRP